MRNILNITTILLLLASIACDSMTTNRFYTYLNEAPDDVKVKRMTKAQLDKIRDKNGKAEAKYNENKDGTDEYSASDIGFEMYINVDKKGDPIQEASEKPDYDKYIFRVNKNAIYYGNEPEGYRGVVGAMNLRDLRSEEEQIGQGDCCKRVTKVGKQTGVNVGSDQMDLYCFALRADEEDWKICHEDKTKANTARGLVVMNVIKNYLVEIGKFGDMSWVSMGSAAFDDWTWLQQKEWPGICRDGKAQSPIDIESAVTTLAPNMRFEWEYKSESVPTVKFNGHEQILEGEFGGFTHKLEIGVRKFRSSKISFKFPGEHQFDGQGFDGEILVYHKSKNGLKAIVSFLVNEVPDGDADHNKFVEGLDVEGWNFDPSKGYRLDARPSPDDLVKGGGHIYLQKTFYWYMGSDSVPECEQEINRFVFKQVIQIPTTQFQAWKEKTYEAESEEKGNARKAKKAIGRLIYYHVDKSKNCKAASDKILEASEDMIADAEAGKDKEFPGKWLKAQTSLHSYGIAWQKLHEPIILENGIRVENIQEGDVPPDTRDTLYRAEMKKRKEITQKAMKANGIDESKVRINYK